MFYVLIIVLYCTNGDLIKSKCERDIAAKISRYDLCLLSSLTVVNRGYQLVITGEFNTKGELNLLYNVFQ